jgi:hypothetical protein
MTAPKKTKCYVCPVEHTLSEELSEYRLIGICCDNGECFKKFCEIRDIDDPWDVYDWGMLVGFFFWFTYY